MNKIEKVTASSLTLNLGLFLKRMDQGKCETLRITYKGETMAYLVSEGCFEDAFRERKKPEIMEVVK